MTTAVLKEKTGRYLCGQSIPAEKTQIQTWLSCTDSRQEISLEERAQIEQEIVAQINAYAVSSLFVPTQAATWWKKITAFF